MKHVLPPLLCLAALPALAEDTRQLDAHVHGVGTLNIAVDGQSLALELITPGADIVGFEYEATSEADMAAIEAALVTLSDPVQLFGISDAAGCEVLLASAELEAEDEHDHDHGEDTDGDHDDHAHGDEDHGDEVHGHEGHDGDKDHAEGEHDHDHGEEHAHGEEHDHDHGEAHAHAEDNDHDHGEDHAHDDHDHGEEHAEARHTEFHAEYLMTCSSLEDIGTLELTYFESFENALELEVQVVSSAGAQATELTREAPTLDLGSLF
ncbi:zinc uptake protein ZrgA [Pseudaestuariivita sp.]|uniref:zinc uptake protein ZrgA n=1 Tax=Pseudaestuariivita sp. TaxID=2211669 RepID=UPI0040585B69